ncbi:hypothetical protein [Campylobacter concisus]|nr:hypothetical protein [Campylobacter concisus]
MIRLAQTFAEGIAYAYEKRVPIKEDVYCDFIYQMLKELLKFGVSLNL